ncbi:MAG TPA: DUF6391 domain-containing protein [Anaerolineaceae bacterium]
MPPSTSMLNWAPVSRLRRNHALEHATLAILGVKLPHAHLAGYSDPQGFWILGDVSTADLMEAVAQAIGRLRAGERALAVHPRCGTNFVAAGMIGGFAAWLAMLFTGRSFRRKLERLPVVITVVTAGLIASQTVGPLLQEKLTTNPDPGTLEITGINLLRRGGVPIHRIQTRV